MTLTQPTRLEIEKFVYEKGTNVALYQAEHSPEYTRFQAKLEHELNAQVKYIADPKNHLPILMSLAKATSLEMLQQLGALISTVSLSKDINLSAFLIWAGEKGGQAFFDKLGIKSVFGLRSPKFKEYFQNYSNLLIDSVDDYTKKWIAEVIQEGKSNGLSPFEIAKQLVDDGKGINELRAERIVLTETAKAMSTIKREAAERMGLTKHQWHTSRDERVCPICQPLDDQISDDNGVYEGGQEAPPAHVNCRCYEDDIIPDDWHLPASYWQGE